MLDRDNIKWAPFNSVIDGNILVESIEKDKSRIDKPLLSEEQINNLSNTIYEAMINKVEIIFTIYKNGFLLNIEGKIEKINKVSQKIILNHQRYIYFCEIVSINHKMLDFINFIC